MPGRSRSGPPLEAGAPAGRRPTHRRLTSEALTRVSTEGRYSLDPTSSSSPAPIFPKSAWGLQHRSCRGSPAAPLAGCGRGPGAAGVPSNRAYACTSASDCSPNPDANVDRRLLWTVVVSSGTCVSHDELRVDLCALEHQQSHAHQRTLHASAARRCIGLHASTAVELKLWEAQTNLAIHFVAEGIHQHMARAVAPICTLQLSSTAPMPKTVSNQSCAWRASNPQ